MSRANRADFFTGLAICAVAAYIYREASAMPMARRGLGPGGYPIFVAAGLMVLGIILAGKAWLGQSQSTANGSGKDAAEEKNAMKSKRAGNKRILRVGCFILLSFAYALTLRPVGFIPATAIFLVAGTRFFGYRKRVRGLVFALLLAAGVYILFRRGFLVLLPTGSLFQ